MPRGRKPTKPIAAIDRAEEEEREQQPIPDVEPDAPTIPSAEPGLADVEGYTSVNTGAPNVIIPKKEDRHPATPDQFSVYGFSEGGYAVYNPEGVRISGSMEAGAAAKLAKQMQAHYMVMHRDELVRAGKLRGLTAAVPNIQ